MRILESFTFACDVYCAASPRPGQATACRSSSTRSADATRIHYLDPCFIEATYGLDPWWPTRDGHTRALQVEAFRDRLPSVVAQRRSKAEFSEVFWPQLLEANTLELARTGPLADLGWLDTEGFDALIAGATAKQPNADMPLCRCVSLYRWLRIQ